MEDVLEGARQIIRGEMMADEDEEVLGQSTTVQVIQPSPKRQPLEIIVRHSQVVAEQNTDDEDEDDDEHFREAPEGTLEGIGFES